eukprot:TRINITY_DN8491_c0_g1_i1.p1 TRINITY_DN8491_c0_g1~~TRINITY_DN8491_c0_g1_i1.p1  ORF type:complete len:153 (-),score=25.72 TRINITY_DN8491_c0_g1_i1:72-476(-)
MADDILELCKECGIEGLAVESGLIANGEIPVFKNYEPMTPPNKIQGHDPKRRFEETSPSESSSKKRSKGSRNSAEKANKGLRHFSLKVCQKVEQKKLTTYNEVRTTHLLNIKLIFDDDFRLLKSLLENLAFPME